MIGKGEKENYGCDGEQGIARERAHRGGSWVPAGIVDQRGVRGKWKEKGRR